MHKIKEAKKKKLSRSRFVGICRLMSNEDHPVAKCIFQNLQMYMSAVKNIFVQIDKCVCQN